MLGKLFIVSAPSGTGKTSLVNNIVQKLSSQYNISKVVTYTTRKPRPNEINGIDYHFITQEDFDNKIKNKFFLESVIYADKPYGSPANIEQELALNKSLILVIDKNGAKTISEKIKHLVTIWITPPNLEELKNRIKKRGGLSQAQSEHRINLAKQEIKDEEKHKFYKYHVINDNFNKTVNEISSIIKSELVS